MVVVAHRVVELPTEMQRVARAQQTLVVVEEELTPLMRVVLVALVLSVSGGLNKE